MPILTEIRNCGTADSDGSFGTVGWTNETNAQGIADGTGATCIPTPTSFYLKCTNFGFVNIASGAIIHGIEVTVTKKSNTAFITDERIRIVKADVIGTEDKSSLDAWATSYEEKVYGGLGDLWGETWFGSDITDAGFGFALAFEQSGPSQGNVDAVQIKVWYDNGDAVIETTSAYVIEPSLLGYGYDVVNY